MTYVNSKKSTLNYVNTKMQMQGTHKKFNIKRQNWTQYVNKTNITFNCIFHPEQVK